MRSLVDSVVRRLNLPAQDLWREELDAVWKKVVPPAVASAVRPGKWENGVLYLFVANSAQLFEIRRLHLRIIETALRRYFDPTRLRRRIDSNAAVEFGEAAAPIDMQGFQQAIVHAAGRVALVPVLD